MDLIREYWWLAIVVVAIIIAIVLLRPKQRVTLTDSAPIRPHMVSPKAPPEGRGLAGEAAAATSDVTGDIIRAPVHAALDRAGNPVDDLSQIKGVGPKFADALRDAGFVRFDQLAQLTPTEIERLDERSVRSVAASRAIASSSRPIISPATTRTGSSRGSESSSRPLRFALRGPLAGPGGDQLVDLAAIHVDDLERPAVVPELLAGLRQMLEHR